jgi:hypothetical protein
MNNETRLRQALSNLLDAYAACNGEDHPAYLEAEAVLDEKKTRRLGSGPSIIRDEARRSGTDTFQLLDPKPSSGLFVPALRSTTSHPTEMGQLVDCPTAIHTDFDPTQVTGSDCRLETSPLWPGPKLIDRQTVEKQLHSRSLANLHSGSVPAPKTGLKDAGLTCPRDAVSQPLRSNACSSMDGDPLRDIKPVQNLSQGDGRLLPQRDHRNAAHTVSETSLVLDDGPAEVIFFDGLVGVFVDQSLHRTTDVEPAFSGYSLGHSAYRDPAPIPRERF